MEATDTAEPDEFARLLAQLNSAPAAPAQPTAPAQAAAPAPPTAPAQAAAPAPPTAPAQAAAPAQPTAPVAPAFGVAAPYPSRLSPASAVPAPASPSAPPAVTFPAVPPAPAEVAPTPPPLPRAPELMGADELAAPPRQIPPLYEPAPPLVAPPAFDAPIQPVPVQAAPPAAQPAEFQTASAQPAPVSTAAPVSASAQPAPAPTPGPASSAAAPSSSAAGRPPLDFATLLATPVGADDDARAASSAVLFGSGAPDADEPDLARSTTAEKLGLVLAFLIAPIGLIVGIVAAARSANRRGWVIGIVRASIAISALLSIALGIGGYYAYTQFKQQQLHDQTAAASAAFCAALKADPTMYQLPTFGWPAVAATIPDSLTAMQAYEDRWTKLAKVSPAGIKADVTRVASAAKGIIDSVTTSRTIDDASDIATMSEVASASGVPAWHSEYCG